MADQAAVLLNYTQKIQLGLDCCFDFRWRWHHNMQEFF